MFEAKQFELVDFGNCRKLERFSGVDVLRDCPAAKVNNPNALLSRFSKTEVQYQRDKKKWSNVHSLPDDWCIKHQSIVFALRPTPFGHVGVFCEQAANWDWLAGLPLDLTGAKAINLFAYTGGTTMVLAQRGASVVHVDSADSTVRWARENARRSGLQSANIRWIVDDAMKFLEREIRRGKRYDIVVADPPAIGHSGRKLTWKFQRDVGRLVKTLRGVASSQMTALLLSCHTEGFDSSDLKTLFGKHFSSLRSGQLQSGPLDLTSRSGQKLNCGYFFRWHR